MIINLPKDTEFGGYRIRVEDLNHTLEKLTIIPEFNKKTGKPNKNPGPKWLTVSYHPNVAQAIRSASMDLTMNSDTEVTLEEYGSWLESILVDLSNKVADKINEK